MKTLKLQSNLKRSAIALAVATALMACQNLEQDQKAKSDKNKQVDEVITVEKKEAIELEDLLTEVRNQEQIQRLNLQKEEKVKFSKVLQSPVKAPPQPITVTGSRIMSESDGVYAHPGMIAPIVNNNRENYNHFEDNGIFVTSETPVSTFSIDVDTASYSNVRRMLNDGYLPPKDAVRLEEFINYFDYQFAASSDQDMPFSVSTETMPAPWNKDAQLVQIGIKGFEPEQTSLAPSNLVFLVDVSGSMQSPNKLGLVKKSLKLLTKQLRPEDKVSLVVYAGASGVVLEPTSGKEILKIERAIDRLQAGGSTNGAAGIALAYQMAEKAFIKDGINRVILATDGDFNVGVTNHHQLMDLIESKRKTNIFFSSLGFGSGNYNDHLMEQLANKGNGNAAYIDSLKEAKKVLVDERAGTLMTIAKDVKIQVEFNPDVVSEYRLLGYENRLLNREDFNNDKVDAGEIGAGHTVTALYEVVLTDSNAKRVDPLRYSNEQGKSKQASLLSEAAMIKLRYKLPDQDKSRLISQVIPTSDLKEHQIGKNIRFAASAAGFAQLLRGGRYLESWSWNDAIASAKAAKGKDNQGYRSEMIQLMEMAKLLADENSGNEDRVGLLERKN